MDRFELIADVAPKGDQPMAIEELTEGLLEGRQRQVLLGVTGSGKTMTIAKVIERANRPSLVIAHNKTLAAQLYGDLLDLFPGNAVHYFVSYYDYYQPEAYIPHSDTYIEKDSSVNENIDRLRHACTSSLYERRDVIVVASVSCIYGIASPEDYYGMHTTLEVGMELERDQFLAHLAGMQYSRTGRDLERGTFRVRGDIVEVFPSHEELVAVRVEFFDNRVEAIRDVDPFTGKTIRKVPKRLIYPGTHYLVPKEKVQIAIGTIRAELEERAAYFRAKGMMLEESRLSERVNLDLELLETMGYCPGIENYSRHLSGRLPGQPPWSLIGYFPDDYLTIIDESHQTIPQIHGMYHGDRSRKLTLIEHGFRLPSALDNRPLSFEEFEKKTGQVIYVSATPREYEIEMAEGVVVEQINRPTGLLDPEVEVRSAQRQVDDLLAEIRARIELGDRVLVTTLTKRMAEDLADYYKELGLKVEYLHSDIDTLERIRIIREFRLGTFDVIVGINLLREGLDIPEVSLVAILDADKEGYLRTETALIQISGRAARNVRGRVIMYADRVTQSMARAMAETERRRSVQLEYNTEHGIVPSTIKKGVSNLLANIYGREYHDAAVEVEAGGMDDVAPDKITSMVQKLTKEMKEAARELEFEKAAQLRDRIKKLRELELIHLSDAG